MVEGKKEIYPFVEKKPQNEVNWLLCYETLVLMLQVLI